MNEIKHDDAQCEDDAIRRRRVLLRLPFELSK
jgi:hypothetical protein